MPDTIRTSGGGHRAHPRRGGFRNAASIAVSCCHPCACRRRRLRRRAGDGSRFPDRQHPVDRHRLHKCLRDAQSPRDHRPRDHAVGALLRRGRGDPAAAHPRAARRHHRERARRDHRKPRRGRPGLRAAALRAANPGGLGRGRRRARDHRRRRPRDRCRFALPRARLRPLARARGGAGDRKRGLRPARARRKIRDGADDARGPPDRGRRPGGGRARDPAVQGRERRQARAHRADGPVPAPGRRRQRHAHPGRRRCPRRSGRATKPAS